jgi:hypothetical protein
MSNTTCSLMNRRAFLRSGAVAGACAAIVVAGCDEPTATKVETPPVEKGGRKRLDFMKEKSGGLKDTPAGPKKP